MLNLHILASSNEGVLHTLLVGCQGYLDYVLNSAGFVKSNEVFHFSPDFDFIADLIIQVARKH